jgi:ribosomal protein S18 acetylase RimI-like enzyme
MMVIRRAVPADLPTVLAILRSIAGWLHSQGYDQWPDGSPSLSGPRIGAAIRRGEFWLASDGADPVACIAISRDGDADFWTPTELAEPAAYVSKAAVLRRYAGEGVGALLLRWACDRAACEGAAWVRLDVWKTNTELQAYYRRQGWDYLRTVLATGRNSGALFQRQADPDLEARGALVMTAAPAEYPPTPGRGSAVIVATPDGPVAGVVTDVSADWSMGVTVAGWANGEGGPPPIYTVEREGETFTGGVSQVWADPAAVSVNAGLWNRKSGEPARRP